MRLDDATLTRLRDALLEVRRSQGAQVPRGALARLSEALPEGVGMTVDLDAAEAMLAEGRAAEVYDTLAPHEAKFAGDHVNFTGQQIGLERRGVLNRANNDSIERRTFAPPSRIAFEHDVRAGHRLGDPVGAEIQAGVGRIRLV